MNIAPFARSLRLWSALALFLLLAGTAQAQLDPCQALCLDNYEGGNRVFWNSGSSGLGHYAFDELNGGQFIINEVTGEARILGEIVSVTDPNQRFCVDITMTGRVEPGDASYPPTDSPKLEGDTSIYDVFGGPIDTTVWTYWTNLTGTLTGKGDWAGAIVDVVRRGPAPQYGFGANVQDDQLGYSTWLDFTTQQQPSTGHTLPHTWVGDINGRIARQCVEDPFPGTFDDLELCLGVDGEAPTRGFGGSINEGLPGQTLSIVVKSPNDTFNGMPLIVGLNCFFTCEPLPPFYPAPFDMIYMTPGSELSLELFGPNGYYGPANLSPTGFFNFDVPVFAFFQNMSLIFQAYVISDQANNGWLAISNAVRFDIIETAVLGDAPQNVQAVAASSDSIDVSWDDVTINPEGVKGYRVYANGALQTEVFGSTSASLDNLLEQTGYSIEVTAISNLDYETPRSAPALVSTPADVTPPVVMVAAALDASTIEVSFDEAVEAICATDVANYELDHGATVTAATLMENGRSVMLTVTPLATGLNYMLTLNGIEDVSAARNVIPTDTQIPVTGQRVTEGLVALYAFDEGQGAVAADSSGVGSPLDLTIADPTHVTWQNGGLAVNQGTIIESAGAATKIASACQATEEITIEAWVMAFNTTQDGPARIATFSQHTTNRNFTLGQDDEDYLARLRTTDTDNNGMPNLVAPDTAAVALKHLVFTRAADGQWRFWVNGSEMASGTRSGNFGNWNASWHFALANEFTMNRDWLGEYHLVAIYDQALDATEVQKNFNAGH